MTDLRQFIELIPDAVIVANGDGRIIDANQEAVTLTGYGREQLVSLGVDTLVPEQGRTLRKAWRDGLVSSPHIRPMGAVVALTLRRKDGKEVAVDIRLGYLDDARGRLIIAAVRDMQAQRDAQQQLRISEERFRKLTELSSDWYWEQDADFRLIFISDHYNAMSGMKMRPSLSKARWEVDHIWESDTQLREHKAILEAHQPFADLHVMGRDEDGNLHHLSISGSPMFDVNGTFVGYHGVGRDVTEQTVAAKALKESEERFRSLTELSSDWFWEQDENFRFSQVTDSSNRAVVPTQEAIGKTRFELPLEFESAKVREDHFHALQARMPFRDLILRYTIDNRWISVSGKPKFDAQGRFEGYRGVATDVTKRKNAEEHTQYLATRDVLTSLPNRALLQDRLENALISAARNGEKVAVMFVDLDHFKLINDLLGHEAGDSFLKTVAARISACVRKGDTVARIGGDEFVVVLDRLQDPGHADVVAAKIITSMAEPFIGEGSVMPSSASIGIAIAPDDGYDVSTLMRCADMAMYQAKADGRSCYRFYSEALTKKVNRRIDLEGKLRNALENGELALYLQPQLSVATGRLVGAEVLLRWPHGDRMIPPLEFIPVAEESGLIEPIGEYVLEGVGGMMREWQRAGVTVPRIAVNLSSRQVDKGVALLEKLRSLLRSGGLDAQMLEFEITESLIVAEADRRKLKTIRDLVDEGVRISIDDFGVGYSSLSYLRYLPIHGVKIDRSFVLDIATVTKAASIARGILALGHSLGLSVTAEGVEHAAQLDVLKQFGCDLYQGYLISPAIPFAEFSSRFASTPVENDGPLLSIANS
ncbi:MAG: EAL domain-containing protein [Burkholderiales bacterium]